MCTSNFSSAEKSYQSVLLPQAVENVLVLAKKLQEKHSKSKAVINDRYPKIFFKQKLKYS